MLLAYIHTMPDRAHLTRSTMRPRAPLPARPFARAALLALLVAGAAPACGGDGPTSSSGPVASVAVSPDPLRLTVGGSGRVGAVLKDSAGTLIRGRSVFWSIGDTTVATVDQDGLVTAVRPGMVQVSANVEGRSGVGTVEVRSAGPATVVVNPPSATVLVGQTTTFSATVRNAEGDVLTDRAPSWASSNSIVATITQQGVVTGISPGTATITASREGVAGSATITVQPVPVARVTVSPANPSIKKDKTVQMTAKTYDAQGKELTGRAVAWTTSNATVATVSSTGLVTGKAIGIATITATSEGQSASTTVSVHP